jgi:pantetheine-phosphate adenylyltransferase
MTTAVFAGTFDPITNGHFDIIKRSLSFCDKLIIAIGVNAGKNPMFSVLERMTLILESMEQNPELESVYSRIRVVSFGKLLGDFARDEGATLLVRGVRGVSDFEYEMNLGGINKLLAPEIETVLIPTTPSLMSVSSSMVKEVARLGGMIEPFVPPAVAQAVYLKMGKA